MPSSRGRRIWKFVRRFLTFLLVVILLLVIAIHLPFVQRWMGGKVAGILSETLGTEVELDRVKIGLPSSAGLAGLTIYDPSGQELAAVDELDVNIGLFALIGSRIDIDGVYAKGIRTNLVATDSSSNFQFLIDAFAPADTTATPAESDTAATDSSSNWEIDLSDTKVVLEDIDLYYQDDPAETLADLSLDRALLIANDIDLDEQVYDLDDFQVADLDIKLRMPQTEPDTLSADPAPDMRIRLDRLSLHSISVDIEFGSLQVEAFIEEGTSAGGQVDLAPEGIRAALDQFDLRKSKLQYDQNAAPAVAGIDPNHISLAEVEVSFQNLTFENDSLQVDLQQVSAEEENTGLTVRELNGSVMVHPDFAEIDKLLLRTDASRLDMESLYLDLTSLTALERLELLLRAEGRVAVADVLRAQPDLRSTLILGRYPDAAFVFDIAAVAETGELVFDRIDLDGPGVEVNGNGRVRRLDDVEALEGEFDLARLSILPEEVLPLLPEGLLPSYIDWPNKVQAQGSAKYYNQELTLDLGARENRMDMVRWSGFDLAGRIDAPLAFPDSRLRLDIDSLVATRRTILAYLPEELIPPGYRLPDYVGLYGQVTGPVDNLNLNLDLQLPSGGTYARVNGNVQDAMQPEQMVLDLQVAELALDPDELMPLLPDSLLPEYFVPPKLRISGGKLSGKLDDLAFDIPIQTSNGSWQIDGRYNPSDLIVNLAIAEVQPAQLFSGPIRDSLLALNLAPIDIEAKVSGQLQPAMNLLAFATIAEQGQGKILDVDSAIITDNYYAANLAFDHPSFLGGGELAYWLQDTLIDSLARVEASLNLEKLDLERWGLSDRPLIGSGRVQASSLGLDPKQLSAKAKLDDIRLSGDGTVSFIDSLLLLATLDNDDNEIIIESDILEAEISGYFDVVDLPAELTRFVQGYWIDEVQQPEPVINGKNLSLEINVFNPRPLVSGIIPGLTDLSPIQTSFSYRDQEPELLLDLNIDRIEYNGLQLRNTVFEGRGSTDSLRLEGRWAGISLGEGFELGPTQVLAQNTDEELDLRLRVLADNDSLRHGLHLYIDQDEDRLSVRFDPDQVLNFRNWQMPRDNLLALQGTSIEVEDWKLERNGRYLRLSKSDRNGLRLDFKDFKLETLARIINSEEELAAGKINGSAYVDELLTSPAIRAELNIEKLAVMTAPMGDLQAKVRGGQGSDYQIDVGLTGDINQLSVNGTYGQTGALDLDLNVERLGLPSLEPLSLGYLQRTEGFIEGRIDVGGTVTSPRMNGNLVFRDAALAISLLGSRFLLDDERISFNGSTVNFDNFTLQDSLGQSAITNGQIELSNLTNPRLDLQVRAREFLAINSTSEDNELFYGYMQVNAEVDISGTALNPRLIVDASPTGDSRVTYAYTTPAGGGVSSADGVVVFAETFEWDRILERGQRDSTTTEVRGSYIEANISVDEDLLVRAIIDPITRQEFSGRGEGAITFIQQPNGRQELTGRIEMQEGTYDMVLEGLQPYEFQLRPGSSVSFDGNPENPQLDLDVFSAVQTSPIPLVETFNPGAAAASLNRRETFEPSLSLNGDLTQLTIDADILYPNDKYGNRGLEEINDALEALRQDQSRMYTTAITLITFGGFNIPLVESGSGGDNRLVNNLADAVAGELSSFLNNQLGFVDLQLGVENYQTADGQDNFNVSLSLSRSFLDDRLIINVDGVANTAEDAATGESQTYLDNISAEYLLDPSGRLRIKLFNDRDRNVLVGGNVLRFGGRLVFSKDFNRFFWERKKK